MILEKDKRFQVLKREELEKIFEETKSNYVGDNVFQGLLIIGNYINNFKKDVVVAVAHDILYSVEIDELLDFGLTKKDAFILAELGWMLDDDGDCFSCFI